MAGATICEKLPRWGRNWNVAECDRVRQSAAECGRVRQFNYLKSKRLRRRPTILSARGCLALSCSVVLCRSLRQCGRRDSNPQGLPHWILSPARLPVSPLPRSSKVEHPGLVRQSQRAPRRAGATPSVVSLLYFCCLSVVSLYSPIRMFTTLVPGPVWVCA